MWILSFFGLGILLLGIFLVFIPLIGHRIAKKEIVQYNIEVEEFNTKLKADAAKEGKRLHSYELKSTKSSPEFNDSNITWIGIVITVVVSVFPLASLDNHLNNLVTLKVNDQLVSIYQEQIDDLNTEFKSMDMKAGALMNGDTPIATMVQAKVDLTQKLTTVKVYEYNARKEILEREKGGFWWIPLLVKE